MNLTVHTPDTPAQQDRDPQAPHGPLACNIDMAALRALKMKELNDFRSVMHTISEVLCGFSCQPRFGDEEARDGINNAGRLLNDIIDFINGYEQAAVNIARSAKPATAGEIEYRAWTILGFEADMADGLHDIAITAVQAAKDEAEAAFQERHARSA